MQKLFPVMEYVLASNNASFYFSVWVKWDSR